MANHNHRRNVLQQEISIKVHLQASPDQVLPVVQQAILMKDFLTSLRMIRHHQTRKIHPQASPDQVLPQAILMKGLLKSQSMISHHQKSQVHQQKSQEKVPPRSFQSGIKEIRSDALNVKECTAKRFSLEILSHLLITLSTIQACFQLAVLWQVANNHTKQKKKLKSTSTTLTK